MNSSVQSAYGPPERRKLFEDQVKGLEFEHELINRKITWLLTSQSLLFAALGLTLASSSLEIVRIIASLGLAVCVVVAIALAGNIAAKRFVHLDYKRREQSLGSPEPRWGVRGNGEIEFGVRSFTTWLGIAADLAVPLVFAGAWIAVLILAGDIVDAGENAVPSL